MVNYSGAILCDVETSARTFFSVFNPEEAEAKQKEQHEKCTSLNLKKKYRCTAVVKLRALLVHVSLLENNNSSFEKTWRILHTCNPFIYNGNNSAQQQKVMEKKNQLKDINSYTRRKQIRGTPSPTRKFMISFIKIDIKM